MYKWGFYILLGVNAYTSGSQLFSESSINETVLIKVESEKEVREAVQEKRAVKELPAVQKKRTLFVEKPIIGLESEVKDKILVRVVEALKSDYSFFFEYNRLSPDKLRKVELILAEHESSSRLCLGGRSADEALKTSLNQIGLDFSEIHHVLDYLDKEWLCYGLQDLGINPTEIRGDYRDLVDEMYSFHQSLKSSNFNNIAVGLEDPFADADPFADDAPFAEPEFDIQVEIREGILERINILNEEGLEIYDQQVEILSKYIRVPDKMKLELLQNLVNN